MIVAIDGPAGVGKSSVARRVAAALEIPYLDTGAMYRTVGLLVLRAESDPEDEDEVVTLLDDHRLELERSDGGAEVTLDGEPVGDEIRREAVSAMTSRVAVHPGVRRRLIELQRAFAQRHGAVMEGRDIGTVVVPETPHKFFLDASPGVRARRRWEQLRERGEEADLEALRREMEERDRRDASRSEGPLRHDDSYRYVDTSELDLDEVVALVVGEVGDDGRE